MVSRSRSSSMNLTFEGLIMGRNKQLKQMTVMNIDTIMATQVMVVVKVT